MNHVFIDTAFFVAYLSDGDKHQKESERILTEFTGTMWTTGWVFVELANYFSKRPRRQQVPTFIADFSTDPRVRFVPPDMSLFERGLELYGKRPDKHWSLTDCISFLVMEDNSITAALTTDHHFEQAGFQTSMK